MDFRYIKGDWKDFYDAPDEAMILVVDAYGRKYFTDIFPEPGGKYWSALSSHGTWGGGVKPEAFIVIAVREKLAVWNGEFPIPVGTEVEVHFDGDDSRVWTQFRVEYMAGEIVVLHDHRIDNVDAYKHKTLSFRPIRSEADKKRYEVAKGLIEYLDKETDIDNVFSIKDVIGFYDAIATGKIPHIRID
ncbi:Uncharacterised protein [Enterobacter hormaechei]|nr:Uncharacterised protein [Enterobacter hormaechei]CZY61651.1 Uncharacterised protein [Enterobacter hormaechei]CZY72130.1 Uncharacterised protein [Enterobacter hormaechei]SAF37703.1 Uncharacterised protein [Enterobacter hormaechei]